MKIKAKNSAKKHNNRYTRYYSRENKENGDNYGPGKKCPLSDDEVIARVVKLAQLISEKIYYPYQEEYSWGIVYNVLKRKSETLTALFSRQSGKSETVSSTVAAISIVFPYLANMYPDDDRFNRIDEQGRYRGYKSGFAVGIYAPIQKQAAITFNRLRSSSETKSCGKVLDEIGLVKDINNGNTLVLASYDEDGDPIWKSSVSCYSASVNSKIEGDTYDLIVVEEAQDMAEDVIEKSLSPMLSSTLGCMVLIGTSNRRKSFFLRQIRRNLRLMRNYFSGEKLHFFYPAEICSRYNSDYKKFVDKKAQELGEDSDAFRMAFKCEFVLARGMFVTENILLDSKVASTTEWHRDIIDPEDMDKKVPLNYTIVAAVDFAKQHDSTVVTVGAVDWSSPVIDMFIPDDNEEGAEKRYRLFKKHILFWEEIHGDNYEAQVNQIQDRLTPIRRLKKLVADGTGVGSPLCDRLAAIFSPLNVEVESFVFHEKAKSEAFRTFSSDLTRERITFPYSDEAAKTKECKKFIVQMLDAEKDITKRGFLSVSAPNEEDAFDDYVDSACLFNYGCMTPVEETNVDTSTGLGLFRR